jgi:hypothetical protein
VLAILITGCPGKEAVTPQVDGTAGMDHSIFWH